MKTNKLALVAIFSLLIWIPLLTSSSALMTQVPTMRIAYTTSGDDFYGEYNDTGTVADQALLKVLEDGQGVVNGLIGVGLLSSIAAFSVQSFKLSKSGDSKSRSEAINSLIIIAITTACLGGFPLLWSIVLSVLTGN